ncbi:hypothetical protein NU195Hw_Modified_660t1 [Hortaea werneckii]
MTNDNPRPRHLHQPTSQRADLHANELSALAAPQHPNGLRSGVSGRLGTNNGPDLVALTHASRTHSEVDSGDQPPTTYATETASSSVTGYPCVRCWKPCQKYTDMVRHFLELHLILKVFQCPECGKTQKRKAHVVNHYATRHARSREESCIPLEVTCPFVPVAFGCGFCNQGDQRYGPILSGREDILQALSHVKEHIDEGKTRTDWNVTHQIEGLLLHILPDWYEVCRQTFDCPFNDWPRLGWTPESAAAFVSELEQPIARARLRPLLQELLLAGSGPAPSSMSGDRVVSDYSQAQLHSSGYCNQPTQGPPAPLLDSDCCTNDSPINATGDLDNLCPPPEPSDSSLSQPPNAGEQDLLLGAAGSQFPQSPTRVGTYYANADILPSETDQDTITDVGLRNGALDPAPLTTSSWIADQQSMRRPGNGLF